MRNSSTIFSTNPVPEGPTPMTNEMVNTASMRMRSTRVARTTAIILERYAFECGLDILIGVAWRVHSPAHHWRVHGLVLVGSRRSDRDGRRRACLVEQWSWWNKPG